MIGQLLDAIGRATIVVAAAAILALLAIGTVHVLKLWIRTRRREKAYGAEWRRRRAMQQRNGGQR